MIKVDKTALSCVEIQLQAAAELRDAVNAISFSKPVDCVYNPLNYAWDAFAAYVKRFGAGPKRAVFLGMNPGPWGMAQTGVPFGEVSAVRDWMGLDVPVGRPETEHPAYPVRGLDCPRSEVSGKRLWGLFSFRFGSAGNFFTEYFVINYCPLLFIARPRRDKEGNPVGQGYNLTPDHLKGKDREPLYDACDQHLWTVVRALNPRWLIGIGSFAANRAQDVFGESGLKILKILHPSPASPLSNKDWPGTVTRQLVETGVWNMKGINDVEVLK